MCIRDRLQYIYLGWKWSSGWLHSWEGLLLATDVSTTTREAIFRVKWSILDRFRRSNALTARPLMSVRPAETTTRLNEHKWATKRGDLNNIGKHHLKTSHIVNWDSAIWVTHYCVTNDYLTWNSNNLNCFLFILRPLYLHNLSSHSSSQPITSRAYQRLLYLLTNQITHQGFGIFNNRSLYSEDGFRSGCRNVSR